MTDLPWAIYARVSTDDQAEEGASLPAQLASCRAYALARGFTLGEELVDDGYTGLTAERPAFQRLHALIQQRAIGGVIAWKLKRLTRRTRHWLNLSELAIAKNVAIALVMDSIDTSSPQGRAVATVIASFGQLESEEIGAQTKLGMQYLQSKGYFIGGSIPSGCRVIAVDEGKRRKLEPNQYAPAVMRAWEWVLAGDSLGEVAARLDTAGVPSAARQGRVSRKRWTPTSVRNFLLSKQLVGVLVDGATQAKVRAALAKRGSPTRQLPSLPGERAARPSILAGLFRCPLCGGATLQVTATGNGGAYRYFRCVQANKSRRFCPQKDLRCEPIEVRVLADIAEACRSGGDYLTSVRLSLKQAHEALASLKQERVSLISQRDQLAARVSTLTLNGQIGTPAWTEAMKALGAELERIDLRLSQLQGHIAAASVSQTSMDVTLAGISAYAAKLGKLDEVEQRAVLRDLVRTVRIDGDHLVTELYEPAAPLSEGGGSCPAHLWGPTRHHTRTVPVRRPFLMPKRTPGRPPREAGTPLR